MKIKKLQLIFSLVLIFLLIAGCVNLQEDQQEKSDDTENNSNNAENISDEGTSVENGFIIFDYPPFDLDKVAFILPMGGTTGGHVTPIDHQYYISYDFAKDDDAVVDIDVYSPGDGVVTEIQHMSVAAGDTPMAVDDFRIIIQHTSTISSYYIHIDELSDKIAAVDPGLGEYAYVNVEVSAGEIIGRYGGSVDYNIVDDDVVLPFVNLDSYTNEPWKLHCPDPFDYFNESIKELMYEKCVRTQDPVGGKICYDVDGKLVGTWFEEGTNGYGGVDLDRYWAGHLSIVYDSIDHDAIIVSIGTFIDTAEQFAVKTNSPDPSDVSVETGLVKYELVDFEYYSNGSIWNRNSYATDLEIKNSQDLQGVILLELIEDRKLKVETFPGKAGDEVTGFTDNFRIYER